MYIYNVVGPLDNENGQFIYLYYATILIISMHLSYGSKVDIIAPFEFIHLFLNKKT